LVNEALVDILFKNAAALMQGSGTSR
jgi:hypothetical protein